MRECVCESVCVCVKRKQKRETKTGKPYSLHRPRTFPRCGAGWLQEQVSVFKQMSVKSNIHDRSLFTCIKSSLRSEAKSHFDFLTDQQEMSSKEQRICYLLIHEEEKCRFLFSLWLENLFLSSRNSNQLFRNLHRQTSALMPLLRIRWLYPPGKPFPRHRTKLHQMVRLHFWKFWPFGVPPHCQYYHVHCDLM